MGEVVPFQERGPMPEVVAPGLAKPTLLVQTQRYNRQQLERVAGWSTFDDAEFADVPSICIVHRDRHDKLMGAWLSSLSIVWVLDGCARIADVTDHITLAGVTHLDLSNFKEYERLNAPITESGFYILTPTGDLQYLPDMGEDEEILELREADTPR